jgi:hypothetical protein
VAISPLILIDAESFSSKGTKLESLKPIRLCRSTFSNCIFFSICVITTSLKKKGYPERIYRMLAITFKNF